MTANNIDIFKPEWLNVVFANRNQAYGAYQLRKDNARTTNMALAIALSGFLLLMAIPVIINRLGSPAAEQSVPHDPLPIIVDLSKVYKVIPPKTQLQQAKPAISKPVNDMVKNLPPVVSAEATEQPPTQTQLQHAESGPVTMQGTHTGVQPIDAKPGVETTAGGGQGTAVENNTNAVLPIAEFNPEYPGGEAAFTRFLQKNIRYPQVAKENGIQGRAYIQFIVERDGSLTDIQIVRNPGGGTGEEAARVLKISPHWKPGKQNGVAVRVQYTVPVNFTLNDN